MPQYPTRLRTFILSGQDYLPDFGGTNIQSVEKTTVKQYPARGY
jgi:hypothetical protein